MFQNITMIDYERPLAKRAQFRKVVGPYRWRPSKPMSGRGFYQDRFNLACDRHGSSFDLRLEEANDHLRGRRIAQIFSYYADEFGDDTLKPIIARLPHGRGFLAGWTMGRGMYASLDSHRYEDAESAAYAAHSLAEYDATESRKLAENDSDD